MNPTSRRAVRALLPFAALGVLVAAGGCRAPRASDLSRWYGRSLSQNQKVDSARDLERQYERDSKTRAKVVELVEAGALETAEQHFLAAALLVNSESMEQIELARELALHSAELGDDRGFRVAAEAIDRGLLKRGRPQKYGTQYVYEPVIQRWELYPCDARTSDAERFAMGVPTLAEARARVAELNGRVVIE